MKTFATEEHSPAGYLPYGQYLVERKFAHTPIDEPVNVSSKRHYRFGNVERLTVQAIAAGYRTGLWGTETQWRSLGYEVRAGETGALVYFDLRRGAKKRRHDDEEDDPAYSGAKEYTVYNVAQTRLCEAENED